MIDISQKEFENMVEKMIHGEYTRADMIKKLHTDRVTLNNKIQELSVSNIDLYVRFVQKFPYVPREYTHIDYEAMMIDIMKKGYTKKQAAEQYGISDKTITRKIKALENEGNQYVPIYRQVANYRKHKYKLPEELQKIVDSIEAKPVFIGGIYDKREKELIEKERMYTQSRMEGKSDTSQYGNRRTCKDLNTLYRLKIEQQINSDSRDAKNSSSDKYTSKDTDFEQDI